MLLHRWRFKKRPTPPTNLAIEAYYQNVHLLLRKWMQLQLNLDFKHTKNFIQNEINRQSRGF